MLIIQHVYYIELIFHFKFEVQIIQVFVSVSLKINQSKSFRKFDICGKSGYRVKKEKKI